MSGIAAAPNLATMRRVLRMRSLVSGPLAMERKAFRHDPVMVEEILDLFDLKPGAVVVDGTLGLGGHSERFLQAIAPGGTLLGFDWDNGMLLSAKARLEGATDATMHFINDDFRQIGKVMDELALKADAILLDLGLNSAQVDDPERGISFNADGPLDMRMDRTRGEPASAVLNRLSIAELEEMLQDYGDERWARMIARKVVERRKVAPLRTTSDLVDCVLAAIPLGARDKRIHPATRTFQAVRIYVNGELEELDSALSDAAGRLAPGGVLAVLSYHSGEDRIVKNEFRRLAEIGFEDLYRKPSIPTEREISRNPRSRSAKLRAIRRYNVV